MTIACMLSGAVCPWYGLPRETGSRGMVRQRAVHCRLQWQFPVFAHGAWPDSAWKRDPVHPLASTPIIGRIIGVPCNMDWEPVKSKTLGDPILGCWNWWWERQMSPLWWGKKTWTCEAGWKITIRCSRAHLYQYYLHTAVKSPESDFANVWLISDFFLTMWTAQVTLNLTFLYQHLQ